MDAMESGICLSAGADSEASLTRPPVLRLSDHSPDGRDRRLRPAANPFRRPGSSVKDVQIQFQKQKKHPNGMLFCLESGSCLSSHAVASTVLSVYEGLTSVFGMGTGGSPQLNHRKDFGTEYLDSCIFHIVNSL